MFTVTRGASPSMAELVQTAMNPSSYLIRPAVWVGPVPGLPPVLTEFSTDRAANKF